MDIFQSDTISLFIKNIEVLQGLSKLKFKPKQWK